MPLVITNFILFQLGWFSCVLGAANDLPWLGPIVVLLIVIIHLALASILLEEVQLIFITLLIGGIWDSIMVLAGLMIFPSGMFASFLAPYWILALWILFATTLNVSFRWMKNRYLLAACLGGLAGPLAYFAGFKLDAVSMNEPLVSSLIIGVGWFFIMPLLMWVSMRFDGFPARQEAQL